MRRTTPPATLWALFTAVVVLLSVLGMHVLSGGPHASGGVGHNPARYLTPSADVRAGAQPNLHGLSQDSIAAASAFTQSDLPSGPLDALVAMCLAVLLGVVVVLAVRTNRRARAPQARWSPRATILRLGLLTRAPPPDLLTRLCVLRT